MADLVDLGPPPAFAQILRAAEAIRGLRLDVDTRVPDYLAAQAAQLGKASDTAMKALALAIEVEQEGVRMPVGPLPEPGIPVVTLAAAFPGVHAELERFVAIAGATPEPEEWSPERSAAWQATTRFATTALDAIEAQRQEALRSRGPQRPPDPIPPAPTAPTPHASPDPVPPDRPPSPAPAPGDDVARLAAAAATRERARRAAEQQQLASQRQRGVER
jgi:hypothetical protein